MTDAAMTLLFSQRVGALDRIISLIRRRSFPIHGLSVERTQREDIGRMTVIVERRDALEQMRRQLIRLPDVLEVSMPEEDNSVRREYTMLRVRCAPEQRAEVNTLLTAFDARVVSTTEDYLVVEAAGDGGALDALHAELAPHGIEESARTSSIVLSRTSTTNSEFVA